MGFFPYLLVFMGFWIDTKARMIEYFEFGEGCGIMSEISLRSKPLDVKNPKGCVFVKFPVTDELESGPYQENFRIEDQIST